MCVCACVRMHTRVCVLLTRCSSVAYAWCKSLYPSVRSGSKQVLSMHKKVSVSSVVCPIVTYKFHMRPNRVDYITNAFSAILRHVVYAICTLYARSDFPKYGVERLRDASITWPRHATIARLMYATHLQRLCNVPVVYQKRILSFKCLSKIIALEIQCHEYWYKVDHCFRSLSGERQVTVEYTCIGKT